MSEWRRIGVDELAAAPALDLKLNWNDMLVQIREQLGVSPTPPPKTAVPPIGFRTSREAAAEDKAGEWLRALRGQPKMTKAAAQEAVTAAVTNVGRLTRLAFERAWRANVDPEWTRPGAPKKTS
jgi:hypothetical protein